MTPFIIVPHPLLTSKPISRYMSEIRGSRSYATRISVHTFHFFNLISSNFEAVQSSQVVAGAWSILGVALCFVFNVGSDWTLSMIEMCSDQWFRLCSKVVQTKLMEFFLTDYIPPSHCKVLVLLTYCRCMKLIVPSISVIKIRTLRVSYSRWIARCTQYLHWWEPEN